MFGQSLQTGPGGGGGGGRPGPARPVVQPGPAASVPTELNRLQCIPAVAAAAAVVEGELLSLHAVHETQLGSAAQAAQQAGAPSTGREPGLITPALLCWQVSPWIWLALVPAPTGAGIERWCAAGGVRRVVCGGWCAAVGVRRLVRGANCA